MIYKAYVSFTRRKISFFVLPLLVVSFIFIIYQVSIFVQLSNDFKNPKIILVRGVHPKDSRFYEPNIENKFVCIRSLEEIDFKKVNDDYCDCRDGSDEPGTNACQTGVFYCKNQNRLPKAIHSSKVNDGICDCCDGSDEWKNIDVLQNFNYAQQKKMHKYHPRCPDVC
ncbi:glucosidase 2 subunit beta [Diabrotica virgifera virgifera]|uniref:Glucosidase 2 subunit beta n=1 Tax=Diabrotica virgifera virgifera TaxID=50390 RepID=A0A6P7GFX6_DIAVI|nr:glucosidase 2 subunit beta [Diabrotica virgifera virgifera]